jgi:hypothetical protein
MSQFEEPVALPRGVADADGRHGFVRNGRDTIDAIRLDTGALMWSSGLEAEPLLVAGSRLVAASPSRTRQNGLEILLLDIDGRGRSVGRHELELPDGVSVSSQDRRDFEYVTRLEGESLTLSWKARTRYRGGTPPPQPVGPAERGELRGRVIVDLETGSARELPSEPLPEPNLPPSQPYQVQSVWREEAWRAGSQILRLSLAGSGEHRTLVLEGQGAGGGGWAKELLEGSRFEAQGTPCGRYVFARTSRPPGDEWAVFSAETGERLTTVRYEEGYQWPCVIGARIYYLTTGGPHLAASAAMTLRAADLHTGQLLWEHDLGAPGRRPPALAR